jgi:hypothetical protein
MLGFFQGDERAFSAQACELWQANRIPHSPLSPYTRFQRWLHTDSEENYYARGNKDFAVESVGYEFNSLGYRGPELALEPGEVGVMFLGDSNTFGLGMPWDQLWCSVVARRLQERWGVAVRPFNLAWSATGPDYTAMMIHQTVDMLRPAAVFILWSFVGRMTWYPDPKHQVHFIPEWTSEFHAESHAAYLRLASQSHGFFNYVRNFHLVHERLSRLGIPYYWGHLEQFSERLLSPYVPLDRFVGTWQTIDLARDARHAGIQSHQLFADRVMGAVARDARYVPALSQCNSNRVARRPRPARVAERLVGLVPRSLRRRIAEWQLTWRVRAMKRKDPFIY